eukprot:15430125-Alexandrium_andersonii.AAC.1
MAGDSPEAPAKVSEVAPNPARGSRAAETGARLQATCASVVAAVGGGRVGARQVYPGHTPEGDGHELVRERLDGTWEQGVRLYEMHPLMRRIVGSSEEAARLSWTADQTQEDGTQVRANQLVDSHNDITARLCLTNLDSEDAMNRAVKSFRGRRAAGLGFAPAGDIFCNVDRPVMDAKSMSDTWGGARQMGGRLERLCPRDPAAAGAAPATKGS